MHKYIDTYLWIKETNKLATNNLLDYFKSKNIDLSRIIFAKRENLYEDHLARYTKGDLLLDTFLYNGHTTTIEALWSGLPVITLEGNSFASRVSASILKSIGLDELISSSKEEYIEKDSEEIFDCGIRYLYNKKNNIVYDPNNNYKCIGKREYNNILNSYYINYCE